MSTSAAVISTCDLCDAHGEAVRVLALPLRDYGGRRSFGGCVSTVQAFEDNSRVREALDETGAGRVLVIDGGGSLRRSMLGDQLADNAARNGWSGVIVIGAIRDTAVIATLPLGVKALGTCPRKTDKRGVGERDVTLQIGDIGIRPGDWLWADADGVVLADHALA